MKKILVLIVVGICVATLSGPAAAGRKAPQKVIELAHAKLAKLGADAVIAKAVKAENAKGKSLTQIKDMDKKWMATPGVADFMKALIENECGRRLKEIRNSAPYFEEIFVMDNQGANVCMTGKTSDYWQGDEDKFIKSFNGGRGAVDISDLKFDDSTQAYIVQVSVPVTSGGKAIGAITFGINPDRMY